MDLERPYIEVDLSRPQARYIHQPSGAAFPIPRGPKQEIDAAGARWLADHVGLTVYVNGKPTWKVGPGGRREEVRG